MTNDQLSLVRTLLTDILRRDGPQPGARLKLQLGRAYVARTGQPFHEQLLGFPKFARLLEAQADLLVVDRPSAGPGDVIISLRGVAPNPSRPAPITQGTVDWSSPGSSAWIHASPPGGRGFKPALSPSWLISKSLWSAFINPDSNRERYLHKPTSEVLIFSRTSARSVDAMIRQRLDMQRADCVAIDYIRFEVQVGWMEDFVRSFLAENRQELAMSDVRQLNQWTAQTGFQNIVGAEQAESWRRFRFDRVIVRIREWLKANGLPESVMTAATAAAEVLQHRNRMSAQRTGERDNSTSTSASSQPALTTRPSLRDLLHALIDTLPEDQLDHVLVPGAAVARLTSILRTVRG